MPGLASYIEDLTHELSHLALEHEMPDLAYLLSMASKEASAQRGPDRELMQESIDQAGN